MSAKPFDLKPGPTQASPSKHQLEVRVEKLQKTVEKYLPDFARMVKESKTTGISVTYLHQDAFAAGYHYDEYVLLGMAIKYAGIFGLSVNIIGTNEETV